MGGGLSEKEKILATIKADRDVKVAEALAKVQVPGVVICGGGSATARGTSLTETLMNLVLLKATGVLPACPGRQVSTNQENVAMLSQTVTEAT